MFKEEILENKRRREIYSTIKKNPGLYVRELQRTIKIPLGSLQYHLNYMAQRNIITKEKSAHYTRFYCSPLSDEERKLLSILRHSRLREIVMIILVNKKAKYQFIVRAINLPPATVSFYLKCLVEKGIVLRTQIGYENIYTLKDEKSTEKIFVFFQSCLLDKLVDKWTATWLETVSPHVGAKEENVSSNSNALNSKVLSLRGRKFLVYLGHATRIWREHTQHLVLSG